MDCPTLNSSERSVADSIFPSEPRSWRCFSALCMGFYTFLTPQLSTLSSRQLCFTWYDHVSEGYRRGTDMALEYYLRCTSMLAPSPRQESRLASASIQPWIVRIHLQSSVTNLCLRHGGVHLSTSTATCHSPEHELHFARAGGTFHYRSHSLAKNWRTI